MPGLDTKQILAEAVRLLRESSRHFKSRQVAEARRLIEQALEELGKDPRNDRS